MTNSSVAPSAHPVPTGDLEHIGSIVPRALSFRAGVYKVPSCTSAAVYTVRLVPDAYCSCPDGRGGECKHVMVVRVDPVLA